MHCNKGKQNKTPISSHIKEDKFLATHKAKYEKLEVVSDRVCAYEQDPGFHPWHHSQEL